LTWLEPGQERLYLVQQLLQLMGAQMQSPLGCCCELLQCCCTILLLLLLIQHRNLLRDVMQLAHLTLWQHVSRSLHQLLQLLLLLPVLLLLMPLRAYNILKSPERASCGSVHML
jgi:hypothetical protein